MLLVLLVEEEEEEEEEGFCCCDMMLSSNIKWVFSTVKIAFLPSIEPSKEMTLNCGFELSTLLYWNLDIKVLSVSFGSVDMM